MGGASLTLAGHHILFQWRLFTYCSNDSYSHAVQMAAVHICRFHTWVAFQQSPSQPMCATLGCYKYCILQMIALPHRNAHYIFVMRNFRYQMHLQVCLQMHPLILLQMHWHRVYIFEACMRFSSEEIYSTKLQVLYCTVSTLTLGFFFFAQVHSHAHLE